MSRFKARFFEGKIHPQVSDSLALAPAIRQVMQALLKAPLLSGCPMERM
jgi:hypothetical protein